MSEGDLAEVKQDERTMALLAHLSPMFGGFIGPMIIYLVKKDESEFVAYHALQSLLYQVGVLVFAFVIVVPATLVTCGMAFPLAFLPHILSFLHAVKANNGEWSGYPMIDHVGRPPGR